MNFTSYINKIPEPGYNYFYHAIIPTHDKPTNTSGIVTTSSPMDAELYDDFVEQLATYWNAPPHAVIITALTLTR